MCEVLGWVHVVEDKAQWHALVKTESDELKSSCPYWTDKFYPSRNLKILQKWIFGLCGRRKMTWRAERFQRFRSMDSIALIFCCVIWRRNVSKFPPISDKQFWVVPEWQSGTLQAQCTEEHCAPTHIAFLPLQISWNGNLKYKMRPTIACRGLRGARPDSSSPPWQGLLRFLDWVVLELTVLSVSTAIRFPSLPGHPDFSVRFVSESARLRFGRPANRASRGPFNLQRSQPSLSLGLLRSLPPPTWLLSYTMNVRLLFSPVE